MSLLSMPVSRASLLLTLASGIVAAKPCTFSVLSSMFAVISTSVLVSPAALLHIIVLLMVTTGIITSIPCSWGLLRLCECLLSSLLFSFVSTPSRLHLTVLLIRISGNNRHSHTSLLEPSALSWLFAICHLYCQRVSPYSGPCFYFSETLIIRTRRNPACLQYI